jgi:hypothetical protein
MLALLITGQLATESSARNAVVHNTVGKQGSGRLRQTIREWLPQTDQITIKESDRVSKGQVNGRLIGRDSLLRCGNYYQRSDSKQTQPVAEKLILERGASAQRDTALDLLIRKHLRNPKRRRCRRTPNLLLRHSSRLFSSLPGPK